MHRSLVYEALGLAEMSARDMRLIKEEDPGFRLRYYTEASRLEGEGYFKKALKIKEFLKKLERLN